MKRIEKPLYLKLSTIYNKILQLTIAVVLVLIIVNVNLISQQNAEQGIQRHYQNIGELQIKQLADSALSHIEKSDRKGLQAVANQVSGQEYVDEVSFFDETGQLIVSSGPALTMKARTTQAMSEPSFNDEQGSKQAEILRQQTSFITEIRGDKLYGYAKLTLNDNPIKSPFKNTTSNQYDQTNMLIILAFIVGLIISRLLAKLTAFRRKTNKE